MAVIESNDHRMHTHEVDLDGMPLFGISAIVEANTGEAMESPEIKTVAELAGELAIHDSVTVLSDSYS